MKPSAVIDSSALINLVHLELAKYLSLYFDAVYVPREVEKEVNRKSRFRYRLRNLYRASVLKKCKVEDETRVRLLNELDKGEAEAISQAQELPANMFIGDEKIARRIAANMKITPVGTARIIARMHLEEYADEPRRLVRKLRKDLNCYIAEGLVEEAIRMATTPIGR
jgi:predicted nucleic acid-binding protein